jgi:PAS domain S-box-containing protein
MYTDKPSYEDLLIQLEKKEVQLQRFIEKEKLENNFENLVKESHDLVCVLGIDGFFKKINSAFVTILGFSEKELLSQPIFSFIHEEDRQESAKELGLLATGQSSGEFQNRYVKKNKEVITIHWIVTLSDEKELIYATGRNFTAFLQIQDKLVESEKVLNDVQQISKIGSWELDLLNKRMTWSKEMFRIYELEERSEQNLFDEFLKVFTLQDQIIFINKIEQSIADKTQFEVEQMATLYTGKNKCFYCNVVPLNIAQENSSILRGSIQDISAKKEFEGTVKEKEIAQLDYKFQITEQQNNIIFRNYIDNTPDAVFVCDENGLYIDVNKAAVELTGYSHQELLLQKFGDLATRGYAEFIPNQFELLKQTGSIKSEMKIIRKDGFKVYCTINAVKLSDNRYLGFVKDITESKIAQENLSNNEKRFRTLVEYNDGIIAVLDKDLNTIFRSQSSLLITGYSDEEFKKIKSVDYYHPDYLHYVREMIQKSVDQPGIPVEISFQIKHKNGNYIWLQGILNNKISDSSVGGIIANLKDVTAFKNAHETIVKEKDKFAKIAETSPGLIYSMRQKKDGTLCYPYASNAVVEIYGFTFKEIENDADKIFANIHPDDIEQVKFSIQHTKQQLIPLKVEYRYFHPKKGLVWHNVNSLPVVEQEGTVICHGIVTDITNRIIAEQKIIRAKRLYFFISQINQMIVRTTDQKTLFTEACSIAVKVGQFKMAWIGMIDEITNKVQPVMIAGDDDQYFSKIKTITIDNNPSGRGPAGRSVREKKSIVSNNVASDPMMLPWREEALLRGYLSIMSVPIMKFGKVIGTFSLYSGEKDFFDDEEIALLEEATNDIGFALEIFEKETLRKQIEEEIIESERRFHILTEVSPVGIFRTDVTGYTTYVNPYWCTLSGLSYQEAIGNGWHKAVHLDDKKELIAGWQKAAQNQQNSETEYRFVRPNGEIVWVIGNAIPEKNFRNEIVGYIGTITDITERKNSEATVIKEKLLSEMIINNLPGIFYLYEADGKFVKWNQNFEEVTGYNAETIATMSAIDFFDIDEKEKIKKRIEAVLENDRNGVENMLEGIEVEIYTKSKNKICYYINSHVIHYEGHKCILGMGIDLTERKKAEEKLQKANERFEMIAAATNDAIFEVDLLTGESWNNPVFVDLLGFGSIEPNGENNINIWRSRVHPDDRERVIKNLEDSYAGTTNLWSDEFRFQKADGTYGIFYDRGVISRDQTGKALRLNGALTEITELKNIKEQLVNSEEKYRSLIEQASDAIFINDISGNLLEVNASACLLLGYTKEELCEKTLPDLYTKKELIDRPIMYKELINGEQTLLERQMLHKNKSLIPVEITAKMMVDGRIVAFVRNVTERKTIDDEFKKMHKKIEAILEAIPDLLFEVDINGVIFNYHSRRDDLLAVPAHEFLGKKFSEILPADAASECTAAIKEASQMGFSTGKQYVLELNGELRWYELSVAPMNESQYHDMHYICLCRDITTAKKSDQALFKSQERYRGLLNSLDAGILVYSPNSTIILSNPKANELLGLTDAEIVGKKVTDYVWECLFEDKSIMPYSSYPVSQIIATKEPLKNFVMGVIHPKTKVIRWILVNGYPDLDQSGNINEIVISFLDITEQKVLDMELIKSKELAESANKAKTDFLANMSHEIRTPLNGIIGFTHLLMKSNLKKNQAEYMTTVNESATSLMEIVNDVLDFSKIESGKLELNIEKVNLYRLTNQVTNLFKYQAKSKKIELILNIEQNVPQYILADSVRLKQILVNLLSNAVKFTNFGEIQLDIFEMPSSEIKSSIIKFSVKDTGIGIKTINNEKIFKSFVQEDNSTNRKFGGTGLGLAITNQLLALMDSKVQLISKFGEGSDFFFIAKFTKAKHNKLQEITVEKTITEDTSLFLNVLINKKVLIVEDNKINMLLAKTLIKRAIANCVIFEAKDGNEAVELYKEQKPDLILMDIQMPNKNGYEATREIRDMEGDLKVPIIAITAGIMTGDREKCLDAGMNDYLPKPIIQHDLQELLNKWLSKE